MSMFRWPVGIIPARAGFTTFVCVVWFTCWDHPRSRGVYTFALFALRCSSGSSPLARGLQRNKVTNGLPFRIIPARAGFTLRLRRKHGRCRDHPRSRGVYSTPTWTTRESPGSSPLARGLPAGDCPCPSPVGIIPARAGFTKRVPAPRPHLRDHPRSRGVYPSLFVPPASPVGSSPLARGLLGRGRGKSLSVRIIPARAGFTSPPHAFTFEVEGSSPLARGLHLLGKTSPVIPGIIPARAGFTASTRGPSVTGADHPRSRGVYPLNAIGQLGGYGIIPARAGFTCLLIAFPRRSRDHPRSRGVYGTIFGK